MVSGSVATEITGQDQHGGAKARKYTDEGVEAARAPLRCRRRPAAGWRGRVKLGHTSSSHRHLLACPVSPARSRAQRARHRSAPPDPVSPYLRVDARPVSHVISDDPVNRHLPTAKKCRSVDRGEKRLTASNRSSVISSFEGSFGSWELVVGSCRARLPDRITHPCPGARSCGC
jgi:hypothetical protein